jgi:hypothetical protein
MLWQSSRIMPLLNFIQWDGLTYPYSKRTKRPGVATRSLNSQFAIAPGTAAPDIETLSILGGAILTDTVLMKMKPQLRENEIAGTMEAAGLMFDRLFIQGNPAASGHLNEFYGMAARIPATMTLVNNGGVAAKPQHLYVSQLLDMVSGPNSSKKLLMNRTSRRQLSEDVKANAGGKGVFDVATQLTAYDNAQIVEVEKDEFDNDIMPFNETAGGSNVTSSIYCVKFGGAVDERDVQGIIATELQYTDVGNFGEYYRDVVQLTAGIGVFGGFSAARLTGLLAA